MTKPTKWHVLPAKTQISLGIRPVWPESSLSAWRKLGSLATHWAQTKTDQTERMHRLIWVFAGCICHFVGFVMRRLNSILWRQNASHEPYPNGSLIQRRMLKYQFAPSGLWDDGDTGRTKLTDAQERNGCYITENDLRELWEYTIDLSVKRRSPSVRFEPNHAVLHV